MEDLLRVSDLSRWRGGQYVVCKLSFTLQRGEVLGLLGPNGAGKTTCLQMLSGNLTPDSGAIEIAGSDLLGDPIAAKRNLGYLPERPPLYPDLRVDEYLGFCARLRGVPRRWAAEAVTQAKTRCGLSQVGARLIRKLSKGYQQRVGLAQAIAHRPALLILDEPTEGLDPIQIQEMRKLVAELSRDCGIILASHLLAEIQAVCTRVQILNAGRLVYSTPLRDETAGDQPVLNIALDRAASAEGLAGMRGVARVTRVGPSRFQIQLAEGATNSGLAEQLVAAGFGLRALVPERHSLEQIFLDIISRDPEA